MTPWTVDTLAAHIAALAAEADRRYEQRFAAQERAVLAALAAVKEATDKQERTNNERFKTANEFRGQLADQAATFMPRREAEARIEQNTEKFEELRTATASSFASMGSRLDLAQGRNNGLNAGWAYLIGFVGLVGGLVGLIVALH